MDPGADASPPRSPGRPRLYEPDAERKLILAATLEVLRRNQGEEATVADILQEANLSTRAFYRHFETKEDVIRALYERDAAAFGALLRRAVEAAGDAREALVAWVNEVLGLAYDRPRAERVAALSSPMVLRVVGGTRAQREANEGMSQPLHDVLGDGARSGRFPKAQPDLDVHTISAITMEAVMWARDGSVTLTRQEALDHVLRFAEGALGLS